MSDFNFMPEDLKKYAQLIMKCIECGAASDGKIPKTKLAKLVYLSDFSKFYFTLESISGLTYKKLPQGPVALEFLELVELMFEEGYINTQEKQLTDGKRTYLISIGDKKLDCNLLSDEELVYIDKVCNKWAASSTKEIVDFTHKQLPWSISFDNEEIPYSLITQEEIENVY